MKDNLISTRFGIAMILAYVSFGHKKAYRIRLTENSISPGMIIEFYPIPEEKIQKRSLYERHISKRFFRNS